MRDETTIQGITFTAENMREDGTLTAFPHPVYLEDSSTPGYLWKAVKSEYNVIERIEYHFSRKEAYYHLKRENWFFRAIR